MRDPETLTNSGELPPRLGKLLNSVVLGLRIAARIGALLPWRMTPWTPLPWARCHCGELADWHALTGGDWCMPCKYAMHDTCECSQEPANA